MNFTMFINTLDFLLYGFEISTGKRHSRVLFKRLTYSLTIGKIYCCI